MPHVFSGNPLKVIVSRDEVRLFNSRWPCSELRDSRAYWFEFDERGDLVDTDVPEHDDGSAAAAMAEDCKAYLFDARLPEWRFPVMTSREQALADALEAIRNRLKGPRDYSHPPSIATLCDELDGIATLALAQNVWGTK